MSAVTQAGVSRARSHEGRRDRTEGPEMDRDGKLLLSVVEAARRLGIGRTLMYELVLSGEVRSVHVGRLRKVPVEALRAYVAALGDAEDAAPSR